MLQGGLRHPGEKIRHIATAVDPHMQQYARQLKRMRSSYEGLDISKKKKARLGGPISSGTGGMSAKAEVPRIIDSYPRLAPKRVKCDQNPTQVTQPELATQTVPEGLHASPSTPGASIRIAASNRTEERPLQANGTSQRLHLLRSMARRLEQDYKVKYNWKEGIQWHPNLLPTSVHFSTSEYCHLTYGQLLQALKPSERQEYLRFVMRNQSDKLVTTFKVSTHLASALWYRAELAEPISVDQFENHLRSLACHSVLTAIANLCELEKTLSARENGT